LCKLRIQPEAQMKRRENRYAVARLGLSLEDPADVVQTISHRHLEITMARVGMDLKIFEIHEGKGRGEGMRLEKLMRETSPAKNEDQDIGNIMNTPFQITFNTEDSGLCLLPQASRDVGPLQRIHDLSNEGDAYLAFYFPSEIVENAKCLAERVLFVNMGGNIGNQEE
jgi:hypothetical protein